MNARAGVGLVVVALTAGACVGPPARVAATADTVAAITRSRIVAVHYHDLGTPGPLWTGDHDRRSVVLLAAPTRRVKERFLATLRATVGPYEVRNVAEPRFAYFARVGEIDAGRLRRTFGGGLAFDFYSPFRVMPPDGGGPVAGRTTTIQARLVRLDDLAVLWAEACTFEMGPLPPPPQLPGTVGGEALYTASALDRAERCADTLVAALTGRPVR